MVGEEGPPALAGRARRPATTIALNRAPARHDPELEELAPDALGTPGRVVARHRADQLPHLRAQARPAERCPRPPPPPEAPRLRVPPNDGLGLHEYEVAAPVAQEPAGHHPDEFV